MAQPVTKKRTASQRGKHSRRKGSTFEREVARILQPVYPNAKRGIGQTRSASEVPDVQGTPWWVEAKHHRKVNIRKAFEQAIDARNKAVPSKNLQRILPVMVVSRDNGKTTLATIDLDVMLVLLHKVESMSRPETESLPVQTSNKTVANEGNNHDDDERNDQPRAPEQLRPRVG
jgi:hypothetical protein